MVEGQVSRANIRGADMRWTKTGLNIYEREEEVKQQVCESSVVRKVYKKLIDGVLSRMKMER